jgi:hypothetical protein
MREIADSARRHDGKAIQAQCRAFIERSADFAVQVLSRPPVAD